MWQNNLVKEAVIFIVQITHMAQFHQVTLISITRIPLISAPMQTDKQKAIGSLKVTVLRAAEVCINSQLSHRGLFIAFQKNK